MQRLRTTKTIRQMFNSQKNKILEAITELGIDPKKFTTTTDGNTFELQYNEEMRFRVIGQSLTYEAYGSRFFIGLPLQRMVKTNSFDEVVQTFRNWLRNELAAYIEDLATPDLWAQISQENVIVGEGMFENSDQSPFTDEEKQQLRLSIGEFRKLLIEEFKPSDEEVDLVDKRLDYLEGSLDRLNKFDWKSILLSTAVNIVTALSLDTQRGQILFDLLRRAFRHVMMLGS